MRPDSHNLLMTHLTSFSSTQTLWLPLLNSPAVYLLAATTSFRAAIVRHRLSTLPTTTTAMLFAAGGAFLRGYYRRPLIDLESATGSVMIPPSVCVSRSTNYTPNHPTLSTYKPNTRRLVSAWAPPLLLEDLMLAG